MSSLLARLARYSEAKKQAPDPTPASPLTGDAESGRKLQAADLPEAIIQIIEKYDWVTFAELPRRLEDMGFFESEGGKGLYLDEDQNIVLWEGLSDSLATAIVSLLEKERIHFWPATLFTYAADGGQSPDLPLIEEAPSPQDCKTPHWFPVCLRLEKPQVEQ